MNDGSPTRTDLSAEEPTASADAPYDRTRPTVGVPEGPSAGLSPTRADDRKSPRSRRRRHASPRHRAAMALICLAGAGPVAVVVCAFAGAHPVAYTALGVMSTTAVAAVARYLGWR